MLFFKKNALNKKALNASINYLLLVIAVLVTVFQVFWILMSSFKSAMEINQIPPRWFPSSFNWSSYKNVLTERSFGLYFKNSAIVSIGTTFLTMVLATTAGYGFSRFNFKGRKMIFIVVLMTTMFPAVLLIIPYFLMMRTLGLLNTYLAYIWSYTTFSLPFSIWMMKGYFESVPHEIDEAGLVDGCNWFSTFWRLCMPIAAPGMAATAIYSFLLAWNHYLFALALTTRPDKYLIPVGIASLVGEYWTDWSSLMAASMLSIIPVVIFNIFLERHLVRGMTAGAVKG